MKTIDSSSDTFTVILTKTELGFIGNAILETLNALDQREFQTRTGSTIAEAKAIQREVRDIYRGLKGA